MLGSTSVAPIKLRKAPDGDGTAYAANQFDPNLPIFASNGLFVRLSKDGMCASGNQFGAGVYLHDTSHFNYSVEVDGQAPVTLFADTGESIGARFIYGNQGSAELPRQAVTILRESVIHEGMVYERWVVRNHHDRAIKLSLSIKADARFVDMFHVRGFNYTERGQLAVPLLVTIDNKPGLFFAYRGKDGQWLQTLMLFPFTLPNAIDAQSATFVVEVEPQKEAGIGLRIIPIGPQPGPLLSFEELTDDNAPVSADSTPPAISPGALVSLGAGAWMTTFTKACNSALEAYLEWKLGCTKLSSSRPILDDCLARGLRDLHMLRFLTPDGPSICAGLPWYNALFGRDPLITAMQWLTIFPNIARGVLSSLARLQGKTDNPSTGESTGERIGKIPHERHVGELARCNATPFKLYYGSVDSTPLWLWLFAKFIARTGDLAFARTMWPHVLLALNYIWEEMEKGEGYLTYAARPGQALKNQSWRDSPEGVPRADGTPAEGRIAACEVQGYVYAAWTEVAAIAARINHDEVAQELLESAGDLKQRFNVDFWMPERKFIALALDDRGQVDSLASNAGHCLLTGIVAPEHIASVVKGLTSNNMLTRWGVRTLSSADLSFSPAQYHRGTCWIHDTALVAAGLAQAGFKDAAHRVLTGLLKIASRQPHYRLPELICGFDEKQLIAYPSSCSPQAWATGAIPFALVACLGLQPNALDNELRICQPALPPWLGSLCIERLPVGDTFVDLAFKRRRKGRGKRKRTVTEVVVGANPGRVNVIIEDTKVA